MRNRDVIMNHMWINFLHGVQFRLGLCSFFYFVSNRNKNTNKLQVKLDLKRIRITTRNNNNNKKIYFVFLHLNLINCKQEKFFVCALVVFVFAFGFVKDFILIYNVNGIYETNILFMKEGYNNNNKNIFN